MNSRCGYIEHREEMERFFKERDRIMEQPMSKVELSDAEFIQGSYVLAKMNLAPDLAATRITESADRLTARNAELAELRKVEERVAKLADECEQVFGKGGEVSLIALREALAPAQKEAPEPVCICHTPVRSDYREPVPDPNCPKHSPAPHDPTAATEARERDKWCSKRLPSGMYEPLPSFRVLLADHGFSKRDIEIIWNDIARMAEYLAAASARKE